MSTSNSPTPDSWPSPPSSQPLLPRGTGRDSTAIISPAEARYRQTQSVSPTVPYRVGRDCAFVIDNGVAKLVWSIEGRGLGDAT